MSRSPLLAPLLEALALVPRWQSAVAWAALVVTAAVMRATVLASATVPFSGLAGLVPGLALVLILGAMTFFLARSFVAPHAGRARPFYLRATGLYIVTCIAEWFVSLIGTVIVFASNPSSFMMTYGSVLVGSLVGPQMGLEPDQVPDIATLLFGPVARGTEVNE